MVAQGPNVKKLIAHKMSIDAIPDGGGFADGIAFLSDKHRIIEGAKAATRWVMEAIAVVRTAAAPNPFKNADDETIAGEILLKVEESKKLRRRS